MYIRFEYFKDLKKIRKKRIFIFAKLIISCNIQIHRQRRKDFFSSNRKFVAR